jgi:NADH:ubiquinone oxidoreductase subunit D
MADTLIPAITPDLRPELGDTMFEGLGPQGVVEDENLLTLNLGPQHPSTHGVFRLIMQLQGETVIGATPVMGYLHRSTEKLGEART